MTVPIMSKIAALFQRTRLAPYSPPEVQTILYPTDLARMTREDAETHIRGLTHTIYLGDGTVMARVLGRHKMFLPTKDVGLSCHLMMDGYWESWVTLFFARLIKPDMVVFDVGANLGYYTLLFADCVSPSGKVIAVEPVPQTAEYLGKSVSINGYSGRTHIVQAAVGDGTQDKLHIFIPNGELKNATVVTADHPGSFAVATTTIDELAADLPTVDFIKIDAEGAEEAIFRGMKATIARCKPMIALEFNANRSASPADFLDSLIALCGEPEEIGFAGALKPISRKNILEENIHEDKMLFFRTGRSPTL